MLAPMRRLALSALLLFVLAGCGESGPKAVISTKDGDVRVDVEVAETPAAREHGLMGRESLAPEAGMIFVFPETMTGAFWMKNTLIPLSIAFYDESGLIVRILDMEPCRQDPCRLYDPRVPYRGALEVNGGAFADWGVAEGDRLRLER
jgi:uncharacterized membrane protein (UPF0127 family)